MPRPTAATSQKLSPLICTTARTVRATALSLAWRAASIRLLIAAPSTLAAPFASPHYDGVSGATPLAVMKFYGVATPGPDLFLGLSAGSLGETSAARRVEDAVGSLLASGEVPSADARSGISTSDMGDRVVARLRDAQRD